MPKPTGFMEYRRREPSRRGVTERVNDYFEIILPLPRNLLQQQAGRCMDCGIPFCHGMGCPLANRIPEFDDLVYRGRWRKACENLHSTNNFPEITGRVCPGTCETACTLAINDDPVLIRQIERQIADRGFEEGWIKPQRPAKKTGKRVAVVGSGPAGLAAAQQLARAGHDVVVFEKAARIGGLLRCGIPDFKLDKRILDRRLEQMKAEGVQFETGVVVGQDPSTKHLTRDFDAVCLAVGAEVPRDLDVAGRGLENVHFAMEYLTQQNRVNAGEALGPDERRIIAKDKIVVVIGGGDTGSDCVGTARRQGAREIHQFEILPKPPETVNPQTPWPAWPTILRTSTSHEEGCHRRWCVLTKRLSGLGVAVSELHGCEVDWADGPRGPAMTEKPGTEFSMKVDMVLLAMGFVHVVHNGVVERLGLELDERGNIRIDENHMTSREGIFAAGDATLGASLVVRAINEGRQAAAGLDRWLLRR